MKRRLNTPSPDIGAVRVAVRVVGGAARAQFGLNERRDNAHGADVPGFDWNLGCSVLDVFSRATCSRTDVRRGVGLRNAINTPIKVPTAAVKNILSALLTGIEMTALSSRPCEDACLTSSWDSANLRRPQCTHCRPKNAVGRTNRSAGLWKIPA